MRVTEATTGWEIVARVTVTVRVLVRCERTRPPASPPARACRARGDVRDAQRDGGVGGPFDEVRRHALAAGPARLRPLTATITSSARRPARAAGESLKTCTIRSPRGFGVDLHADAAEAPRVVEFAQFARG